MNKHLTGVLALLLTVALLPFQHASAKEAGPWTDQTLIAHAMGGISGETLTNSYEAFLINYEKGHRLFEVDLNLTSDGQLAARHDWLRYLSDRLQPTLPDHLKDGPVTLAEFKRHKILNKYTPLDLDLLLQLLEQYPDAYIVTDTKSEDPEVVQKQFQLIVQQAKAVNPALLERIVPELYEIDMINQVKKIYDFPNYFFSIYMTSYSEKEIISLVKKNNIKAVAMPVERATSTMIGGLSKLGVPVYVHTVNELKEVNKLKKIGVHGFYTDFLTYREVSPDSAAAKTQTAVKAASAAPAGNQTNSVVQAGEKPAAGVPPKETLMQKLASLVIQVFEK
ncbi:phosphatidylinositol-specific phospholipase C/glycerophosphodiester phosphodiesterase family protein [Paenibacillus chitinolyticus]|uniref:phosphatidylinositol-specific phospholipase C/glycerophosphodiester phosphodiesterase family protein n=1 Tax=Paenibacillus chitinolyticus TaxID=79263 RepID=UPI002DC00F93|nr:phosphatidylinositol-specific phospholipase C/glycerophosphodiester phosphodiesterase family protein [Paenibacillus chitinolyticus]MEC0246998.1 phosphatidylinositol-specific phospholipase C/glycerophosphodiester phosphodiesterase family protein [Paenibacillus chitinolyticus]